MYTWKVCEELYQDPPYTRRLAFFNKRHQTISSTRTLLVANHGRRYFITHHTMYRMRGTGRKITI
jgi:hypothetical protein